MKTAFITIFFLIAFSSSAQAYQILSKISGFGGYVYATVECDDGSIKKLTSFPHLGWRVGNEVFNSLKGSSASSYRNFWGAAPYACGEYND